MSAAELQLLHCEPLHDLTTYAQNKPLLRLCLAFCNKPTCLFLLVLTVMQNQEEMNAWLWMCSQMSTSNNLLVTLTNTLCLSTERLLRTC